MVATATLNEHDFDRLIQSVAAGRDAVWAEAKKSDGPGFTVEQMKNFITNLNQYFVYGQVYAYLAG